MRWHHQNQERQSSVVCGPSSRSNIPMSFAIRPVGGGLIWLTSASPLVTQGVRLNQLLLSGAGSNEFRSLAVADRPQYTGNRLLCQVFIASHPRFRRTKHRLRVAIPCSNRTDKVIFSPLMRRYK